MGLRVGMHGNQPRNLPTGWHALPQS